MSLACSSRGQSRRASVHSGRGYSVFPTHARQSSEIRVAGDTYRLALVVQPVGLAVDMFRRPVCQRRERLNPGRFRPDKTVQMSPSGKAGSPAKPNTVPLLLIAVGVFQKLRAKVTQICHGRLSPKGPRVWRYSAQSPGRRCPVMPTAWPASLIAMAAPEVSSGAKSGNSPNLISVFKVPDGRDETDRT